MEREKGGENVMGEEGHGRRKQGWEEDRREGREKEQGKEKGRAGEK